jgi:hypothetical protein
MVVHQTRSYPDKIHPVQMASIPSSASTGVAGFPPGLPQKEHELRLLWQRFSAVHGTMDGWPLKSAMDGWLNLDQGLQEPFPVILVSFDCAGVGVVLGMEHAVHAGQLADLTTQAHGAGCQHRPVRCSQRTDYFQKMTLQYVALSFS